MTFGSLDTLMAATEEELTAVPDVGQTTAESIRDWFAESAVAGSHRAAARGRCRFRRRRSR
ncbi:MAG: helix-hairpin-helix domain-containing protein [Oscillospiraceae bacterium]